MGPRAFFEILPKAESVTKQERNHSRPFGRFRSPFKHQQGTVAISGHASIPMLGEARMRGSAPAARSQESGLPLRLSSRGDLGLNRQPLSLGFFTPEKVSKGRPR